MRVRLSTDMNHIKNSTGESRKEDDLGGRTNITNTCTGQELAIKIPIRLVCVKSWLLPTASSTHLVSGVKGSLLFPSLHLIPIRPEPGIKY